jgi:hypothetical protein
MLKVRSESDTMSSHKRLKRKPPKQTACICTRCGAKSEHWKYEFFKAGMVKCSGCGGNVVAARYA